MRFLLDQSSDARLIPHLLSLGHDAIRVGRDHPPGLSDVDVLVFRQRQAHVGVIYLRVGAYVPLETAIERLDYVLEHHAEQLDQFLVVSPHRVRVRLRGPQQ
jgi:hypothetical protein